MAFSKLRGSNPLCRLQPWKLVRIVRLGWWTPLVLIPAIPLIILLAIIMFLFLSILFLFGFVFYLISLRPLLRSGRGEKTIEAEYWIENEDKL